MIPSRRVRGQPDPALHDRVDAVRADHDIRIRRDAVGEGEPHTVFCFPYPGTMMAIANRSFRLRIIQHL